MDQHNRVCAQIDLDAIAYNMEQMKDQIGKEARLIAVIKTDGYGHGAVPIARMFETFSYVWGYAVACIEEAVSLRKEGIKKPILVMKRHGLEKAQLKVSDGAIREMVASYTRESGVRVLERKLAGICRKAAMHLVSEDVKQIRITEKELKDYLGAPRYYPERQALEERVGVVNGLAWTSVGGELLEVEVNVVPGTGKVELTGNLGDVMKESAHAALSFIRSQADRLGIKGDFYQSKDIHVHFPEGAVPKDGPSAGIAITTAMVSALTGAPVKRGIAMTGEVTLRGRVLPIGGLREKTMAALRNGIKTVIIPAENGRDLDEIDQTVRKALRFVLVDQAEQVLAEALCCLSGGAEAERAMDRKLPGEKSRGTARLRQ